MGKLDDSAQGIVDKPISADEMAAIDQAASQYGAVVQPTSNMVMPTDPVTTDDSATTTPTDTPAAEEVSPEEPVPSGRVPGVVQPPSSTSFTTPETEATPAEAPVDETPTPFVDEAPVDSENQEVETASIEDNDTNSEPAPEDITPQPVEADTFTQEEVSSPTEDTQTESIQESPVEDNSVPIDSGSAGTDEELLEVKQHALEELTPIVDTLDLPAEERFDTLMMIIRASDDKKLIKPAYEAANQIADKDKKARALLDVVNEVNYLTQANPDQ